MWRVTINEPHMLVMGMHDRGKSWTFMGSTVWSHEVLEAAQRIDRGTDGVVQNIKQWKANVLYNLFMGGCDIADGYVGSYSLWRKAHDHGKSRTIFWWAVKMAQVHAFYMHRAGHGGICAVKGSFFEKQLKHKDFIRWLVRQMREEAMKMGYTPPGSVVKAGRSNVCVPCVRPIGGMPQVCPMSHRGAARALQRRSENVFNATVMHLPVIEEMEAPPAPKRRRVRGGDARASKRLKTGRCAWCDARRTRKTCAPVTHIGKTTTQCKTCAVFLCHGGPLGRSCFAAYHLYRQKHPKLTKRELPQFACGKAKCGSCAKGPGKFPPGFSDDTGRLKPRRK